MNTVNYFLVTSPDGEHTIVKSVLIKNMKFELTPLFKSNNITESKLFLAECLEINNAKYNEVLEILTDNAEYKKLVEENPDVPTVFFCSEGCWNDNGTYTVNAPTFSLCSVCCTDERVYLDEDELLDKIYCDYYDKLPNASEVLIKGLADEKFSRYEWKLAIVATLG